ncbi:hypothetical protein ACIHAA_07585 [Streptomyces sp. NPDC052040]|uniref:hypothetical protein n=1 Tax=Streptomyces sp. NPDC052040 TaxID=3365682 RepID=UPI0037D65C4F
MTVTPDPEPLSAPPTPLVVVSFRPMSLIESEIVIVGDDGAEEPFDPVAWFE